MQEVQIKIMQESEYFKRVIEGYALFSWRIQEPLHLKPS